MGFKSLFVKRQTVRFQRLPQRLGKFIQFMAFVDADPVEVPKMTGSPDQNFKGRAGRCLPHGGRRSGGVFRLADEYTSQMQIFGSCEVTPALPTEVFYDARQHVHDRL
ncbi:hypothetical protein SDC9_201417 [bioreactor metagenome]|uniref:Uncharacterized protein n=1 Tax=bioreactor metagenome TaxID=1076179 RepID=A0A645IQX2_9ZZZZ